MLKKTKILLCDILLVIFISVVLSFIINLFRTNKIQLIPSYLHADLYKSISLKEIEGFRCDSYDCFVFDARPHEMFLEDRPVNSFNFPVEEFDFFYGLYLANASKDSRIFIYGRTLSRAYDLELAHNLFLKGFNNITIVIVS